MTCSWCAEAEVGVETSCADASSEATSERPARSGDDSIEFACGHPHLNTVEEYVLLLVQRP